MDGPRTAEPVRFFKGVTGINGPPIWFEFIKGDGWTHGRPNRSKFLKRTAGIHGLPIWSERLKGNAEIYGPLLSSEFIKGME